MSVKLKELSVNVINELNNILSNKLSSTLRFKLLKNKRTIQDHLEIITECQVKLIDEINSRTDDQGNKIKSVNINDNGKIEFENASDEYKFVQDFNNLKNEVFDIPYILNVNELDGIEYNMDNILFMLDINTINTDVNANNIKQVT
jgi:hypothetical protein